jgi:hypothetical protein
VISARHRSAGVSRTKEGQDTSDEEQRAGHEVGNKDANSPANDGDEHEPTGKLRLCKRECAAADAEDRADKCSHLSADDCAGAGCTEASGVPRCALSTVCRRSTSTPPARRLAEDRATLERRTKRLRQRSRTWVLRCACSGGNSARAGWEWHHCAAATPPSRPAGRDGDGRKNVPILGRHAGH